MGQRNKSGNKKGKKKTREKRKKMKMKEQKEKMKEQKEKMKEQKENKKNKEKYSDEEVFYNLPTDVWGIVHSYIDFSCNSVELAMSLIINKGFVRVGGIEFKYDGENVKSDILKNINDNTLLHDVLCYVFDKRLFPKACDFVLKHFGEFYVTLYAAGVSFNPVDRSHETREKAYKKIERMIKESQRHVVEELTRRPKKEV